MASRDLLSADEQGELLLARRAEANEVPIEMIRRQKASGAAFSLACQSSGLEDKEIYLPLGIDPGYFSRIKKGEATLQADLIRPFCTVVNNTIYPEWIAYQVGGTVVQIKSETERLLEAEREKGAKLAERLRYVEGLMLGKVAA